MCNKNILPSFALMDLQIFFSFSFDKVHMHRIFLDKHHLLPSKALVSLVMIGHEPSICGVIRNIAETVTFDLAICFEIHEHSYIRTLYVLR